MEEKSCVWAFSIDFRSKFIYITLSNEGKFRTEKISNTDTFHAVYGMDVLL